MTRPRSDDEFDAWLAAVAERTEPVMAWLGVVFALVVGYELAVEPRGAAASALLWVGWAIWAAFVLEYALKLWLAPNRVRFVRRHPLQLAALAIPTLRVFGFLRLLRLGRALPAARIVSASYRTQGTARRLVRSRLGYVAALATVVAIAAGELAYLFERDRPEPAFDTFGDALVWSFMLVLSLQADPVPASAGARLVMLAGLLFGLVVVTSLAGTIGAYLVEERRERAQVEVDTATTATATIDGEP